MVNTSDRGTWIMGEHDSRSAKPTRLDRGDSADRPIWLRPLIMAMCALHVLAIGFGFVVGGSYLALSAFSALMLVAIVVIDRRMGVF